MCPSILPKLRNKALTFSPRNRTFGFFNLQMTLVLLDHLHTCTHVFGQRMDYRVLQS